MNIRFDIEKAYISMHDRFLYKFDATHKKSPSQLKEYLKYKKIFDLRDRVQKDI